MGLLAIKLLAQYLGGRIAKVLQVKQQSKASADGQARGEGCNDTWYDLQDAAVATISDWMQDAACNRNPLVLLVAGTIYAQEGNYVEALKACHGHQNLEL
jgi:hypothetical protein